MTQQDRTCQLGRAVNFEIPEASPALPVSWNAVLVTWWLRKNPRKTAQPALLPLLEPWNVAAAAVRVMWRPSWGGERKGTTQGSSEDWKQ